MKFSLSLCLSFFFFTQIAFAQFSVSGQITDSAGSPLDFANVLLLNAADSIFIDGTTTLTEGRFDLNPAAAGDYLLRVEMLGFDTYYSDVFTLNSDTAAKDFAAIILTEGGIELATVNVTAEKPVFEQRIDRTVVNVENTITSAGLSALEILERSPGVLVNRQGGISMLGKNGVNVMINGRLNYMPQDALTDFLAGLSADNIVSIELITTPPAEFDAEGNAGYINIILKNNPDDGFNVNYSLAAGYGRGALANGNVNFNLRKNKINLFGGYGYSYDARPEFSDQTRRTGLGDDFFAAYLRKDRNPVRNNQNGRLGLDYQIDDKTTVGVLVSGYINRRDMEEESFISFRPATAPDTIITSDNIEQNYWKHLQTNLNFNRRFQNGTLNIDLDRLLCDNRNPVDYDRDFALADGDFLFNEQLRSRKYSPFSINVANADYTFSAFKTGKLSTGVKAVLSEFENEISADRDGTILPQYTDRSDLSEKVFAAYAQLDRPLSEKITAKVGLRYEYSDTRLLSDTEGTTVDRAFSALFPSLFLQYRPDETQQLNLSYSRRINRLSFSNMAGFAVFLDPRTLFAGNARLQPALADAVQVGYRFKTVNVQVQYTQEDSTIVLFQNRYDPATGITTIVPDNLQKSQLLTASVAFPLRVKKWWNMRLIGQFSYTEAVTAEENLTYTVSQANFFLNGSQTFTLPADYSIELSGFYRSGNVNGNIIVRPMGVLNFGVQKKLKNNARLSFNISDVFNSLRAMVETDIPAENFFAERQFDFSQRTFTLSYSSSFGNSKVKAARKRDSGGEERQRVN